MERTIRDEDIKRIIWDADETGDEDVVAKVIKAENGTFTILKDGIISHVSIDYIKQLFHNGIVDIEI